MFNTVTNSISPANDFDAHVNKIWKENNPIPSDQVVWNNFSVLNEENAQRVKNILDDICSSSTLSKSDALLKILWEKGNNEKKLNEIPVNNILSVINTMCKNQNVYSLFKLLQHNIRCPLNISTYNDEKNSARNILYISPGSLGLPDKDFYILDSMKEKCDEYKKFMKKMLDHVYENKQNNENRVLDLYNFEEKLAAVKLSRADIRDPYLTYNVMSFNELVEKYSNINWAEIFEGLGIVKNDVIVVTQPLYFEKLNELTQSSVYQNYLEWLTILDCAPFCDDKTYEIYFDFYNKFLSGQDKQKPRWKRVLAVINSRIGELVSKKFVTKYFDEQSKDLALQMTYKILAEFRKRIENAEWMGSTTKQKAYEKLDTFIVKIGYPDKWKSFKKLQLYPDKSYYENILLCGKWDVDDELSECYKPVDKTKWHMNAHTVNAYYNSSQNEIVFPAGILQKPFFDKNASLCENYGGFGAVIGHEITHGFDDKGKLYDAHGNLNTWWEKNDEDEFKNKAQVLEEQFNNYKVQDMNVNGKLTLGENIADLGGLTLALEAVKSIGDNENMSEYIKNVFYQWALIWRCNYKPEEMKNRILIDPHSFAFLRVNGIVKNLSEFYESFDVKENDEMYLPPSKRAKIW